MPLTKEATVSINNFSLADGKQPATVKVYGASDDLIEIEGAIQDEFGSYNRASFLHFDDGTILKVEYSPDDSGIWRIERIKNGTAKYSHERCDSEDADPYSDVATLKGKIGSVALWPSAAPTGDDLDDMLSDLEWRDYPPAVLLKVWQVLADHAKGST